MLKIDKFKGNNVYALVDAILISDFLKDWLASNPNIPIFNLFESTINSHIDLFSSPLLLDNNKCYEFFYTLKKVI